ncbi:hypothetical protein ACFL50_06135, partial [Candidatus Latescibacterota bacterium]
RLVCKLVGHWVFMVLAIIVMIIGIIIFVATEWTIAGAAVGVVVFIIGLFLFIWSVLCNWL